ncbi:MAG: ABC transporter ATP-binding protein/permease, partial [Parvimonas sp.]|uniref:ATP-binding cassette domain-containing protein n=1 Tax=Parvimonas sp. TaxID=1944660 RepID=UPI0025F46164
FSKNFLKLLQENLSEVSLMTKFLKSFLSQKILQLAILFSIQGVYIILNLLFPFLNGKFLDVLINADTLNNILDFIYVLSFIGIMDIFFSYTYKLLSLKIKSDISFLVNLSLIEHINKIFIEKFESFNPTYLNERIKEDSDAVVSFWIENSCYFIFNILSFIFITFILAKVNIIVMYSVFVFSFIYFIIYNIIKHPMFKVNKEMLEQSNSFFNNLNEIFLRNREIRTRSEYDKSSKFLNFEYNSLINKVLKFGKISFAFSSIDEFISLIFSIFIFIVGGTYVINKKLTIGEFTVISVYFSMILNIIKYFFNIGQEYQMAKGSLERLMEIKNLEKETNGVKSLKKISKIQLKNFNYKFNENILYKNDLNITFEKGNIYCLTGKNGCGKSTLINSIIGINKINKSGKILIENIEIDNLDMYELRKKNISYMPQKEFFRMLTVEEFIKDTVNVDILKINSDKLFERLFFSEVLNLNDIVKKNVTNLSGGEKQLVSLVVTILKNSDIYVFDEPTSNLNNNLIEPFINYINYLANLQKTVIVISHDPKIINSIKNNIKL